MPSVHRAERSASFPLRSFSCLQRIIPVSRPPTRSRARNCGFFWTFSPRESSLGLRRIWECRSPPLRARSIVCAKPSAIRFSRRTREASPPPTRCFRSNRNCVGRLRRRTGFSPCALWISRGWREPFRCPPGASWCRRCSPTCCRAWQAKRPARTLRCVTVRSRFGRCSRWESLISSLRRTAPCRRPFARCRFSLWNSGFSFGRTIRL